jgi:hypothetical protein
MEFNICFLDTETGEGIQHFLLWHRVRGMNTTFPTVLWHRVRGRNSTFLLWLRVRGRNLTCPILTQGEGKEFSFPSLTQGKGKELNISYCDTKLGEGIQHFLHWHRVRGRNHDLLLWHRVSRRNSIFPILTQSHGKDVNISSLPWI